MTIKKLFSIVVAALLLVCIAGVSSADRILSEAEPIYDVLQDGSEVELHYLWRDDGWIEEYVINDDNTITVRAAALGQSGTRDQSGTRGNNKLESRYVMSETIEGMPVTSVGKIGATSNSIFPILSESFGQLSYKSEGLLSLYGVKVNDTDSYFTEIVLPLTVTEIASHAAISPDPNKGFLHLNRNNATVAVSGLTNITHFGSCSLGQGASPVDLNLKNAKYIGKCAFSTPDVVTDAIPSSYLKGIDEMNNLEYLATYAFHKQDFKNFIFPNQYFEIEGNPFIRCDKLTNIEISPDNQYFMFDGNALYDKTNKRLLCYLYTNAAPSYEIPNGIKDIAPYAFYANESLESITIPASVETIESHAFGNCINLKNVTISEGVKTIADFAFTMYGGISLFDVIIPESVSSIDEYAFEEETILHVKSGSYAHKWAKENNHNFVLTDAQDMSWLSE